MQGVCKRTGVLASQIYSVYTRACRQLLRKVPRMTTNPVAWMIDRTTLSRAEFSAKHGFGKNLIVRLIQGRLQSVTHRISSALWEEWKERGIDQDEFDAVYKTLDVDHAYQTWIKNRRLSNKAHIPKELKADDKLSPFGRLVKAIGSTSKAAQLLVVPDVAVQRDADGRQKSMPVPVKEALTEMKYPHVASLEAAQKRWNNG